MIVGLMRSKVCRVCQQDKKIRNFYKHPTTTDGYMNICRDCHKVEIYQNRDLKREAYNVKRRLRDASPEARARRKLYLARPEVKEMLREAARINYRIKRDNRMKEVI